MENELIDIRNFMDLGGVSDQPIASAYRVTGMYGTEEFAWDYDTLERAQLEFEKYKTKADTVMVSIIDKNFKVIARYKNMAKPQPKAEVQIVQDASGKQTVISAPIPVDGTLIKGSGSGTVYLMEGGRKRPFSTSYYFDTGKYSFGAVKVLDQKIVDYIPQGANINAPSGTSTTSTTTTATVTTPPITSQVQPNAEPTVPASETAAEYEQASLIPGMDFAVSIPDNIAGVPTVYIATGGIIATIAGIGIAIFMWKK